MYVQRLQFLSAPLRVKFERQAVTIYLAGSSITHCGIALRGSVRLAPDRRGRRQKFQIPCCQLNFSSCDVETMSRRRDHHHPMVKKIPVAQRQRHQSWIRCVFLWCVCGLGLIDSFAIQDARRHFSAGRFAVSHQALSTIAGMNEHDKHNPSAYVDSYISQDDHALLIEALQAAGFTTIKTLTPTDDCCPCLHIDTHFPRLLICCG